MNSFISIFKYLVLGSIAGVIFIELMLQVLPVKTGFERPDRYSTPVLHWKPNTDYLSSTGWALKNVRHGTVNNVGYVAPYPYEPKNGSIGVFGDSYIEAQMNSFADTLAGRLNSEFGSTFSFGFAGTTMADHLAAAKHLSSTYKLGWVVILINTGDITSANTPFGDGYYYFSTADDQITLKREPINTSEKAIREKLKNFALPRYLWLNLGIQVKIKEILNAFHDNTNSIKTNSFTDEEKNINFFLNELLLITNMNPKNVIFIVDHGRKLAYNQQHQSNGSTESPTDIFIQKSNNAGFSVIDMAPIYQEHFAKHHFPFEYKPFDSHWNFLGHELAFLETKKLIQTLKNQNKKTHITEAN